MRQIVYPLALAFRLGTLLVVSILGGVFVGHLIDRHFSIAPCGMLFFTVLGMIVATRGIYNAVSLISSKPGR